MKRAIIVGVKDGKDKKTGDDLLFVTCFKLPSKMKNGGLWFPKSSDAVATACINKSRAPKDYEEFLHILPGTLCDLTLGVNDFNGNSFIAKIDIVEKSPFKPEALYI